MVYSPAYDAAYRHFEIACCGGRLVHSGPELLQIAGLGVKHQIARAVDLDAVDARKVQVNTVGIGARGNHEIVLEFVPIPVIHKIHTGIDLSFHNALKIRDVFDW